MEQRYFLTVDWCSKDRRGIFSDREGNPFSKATEHSKDEMDEILGPFGLILSPLSLPFDEETLKHYKRWIPLREYSHQYGVALKVKEKV